MIHQLVLTLKQLNLGSTFLYDFNGEIYYQKAKLYFKVKYRLVHKILVHKKEDTFLQKPLKLHFQKELSGVKGTRKISKVILPNSVPVGQSRLSFTRIETSPIITVGPASQPPRQVYLSPFQNIQDSEIWCKGFIEPNYVKQLFI